MKFLIYAVTIFLMSVSAVAFAHHSVSLLFDTSQEITVEAKVTRFELKNPHVRIYFTRSDDIEGREWMAEGGSGNTLKRRGWKEDMLKVGDTIIMHGHPSRDDRPIVHVQNLQLPNGQELFAEDADRAQFEELRKRRL